MIFEMSFPFIFHYPTILGNESIEFAEKFQYRVYTYVLRFRELKNVNFGNRSILCVYVDDIF